MAERSKKEVGHMQGALYAGIGAFAVVFLIYLFTSMTFFTCLKWGLGLGAVGFFWELLGIGKLVEALQAGGIGGE